MEWGVEELEEDLLEEEIKGEEVCGRCSGGPNHSQTS